MYSTIVDPVSLKHYNIASMKGVNILQKFLSFGHGGALPEVTMVEKRPSPDGTGNFSHKDFFTFYGGNSEWNSVGGAAPPAATTDETVSVAQETVAKLSIDQDKLDEWQCKCAAGGKCVCESNFEIDSACLIYAKSAAEHKSINNILTQELAQARNTIRVWEAQYDAMRKDRDTWKKSEISGEEAIKEQGDKITKQAARIADDEKLELAQSAKIAEQAVHIADDEKLELAQSAKIAEQAVQIADDEKLELAQSAKIAEQAAQIADDEKLELAQSAKIAEQAAQVAEDARLADEHQKLATAAHEAAAEELRAVKVALEASAGDLEIQKQHEQSVLKLAQQELVVAHAAQAQAQSKAEKEHLLMETNHRLALEALELARRANNAAGLAEAMAEKERLAVKLADAALQKAAETAKRLQAQLALLNKPNQRFISSGAKDKFKADLEALLEQSITGELSLDVAANHTYQDEHQGFYYITLDGRILGLENTKGNSDRELFIVVENTDGMHVEYYFEGRYHPFPLQNQTPGETAKHLGHIKSMVMATDEESESDSNYEESDSDDY